MEEKWQGIVNEDMKKCNEARIRLEERDKSQEQNIKESKRLIEQLFDYKNSILTKMTFLEVNKVDIKDMEALRKCVTILKTEKKFMPYIALIISMLVGLSVLVTQVLKMFKITE